MQNLWWRWKALWDPNRFHGWGKTKNYFEGWYFKFVDPTEQQVWALIPGISYPKEGPAHAFIQVVDGKNETAYYEKFTVDQFQPAPDRFALQLGDNFFSKDHLILNLPQLKGELRMQNIVPWPKMLYAPGIMGWFSFVPFMECYHGVVSVDHDLSGQLRINDQDWSFKGGKGYTEKDWGQGFPSTWIWMQCNHFPGTSPISLSASVANIPWLGSHFIGYIVGFLFEGKVHRFATYTGAKMMAKMTEDTVVLAFKDRSYRLEIEAIKAAGSDLVSPMAGEMLGKVNESIQAKIQLRFYKNDRLLYEGMGKNAGLEIAGPVEKLLTDAWRR